MNIKEQIRTEIERQMKYYEEKEMKTRYGEDALFYDGHRKMCAKLLAFLDTLPEQPVSDHHEIEVEFRGEKVTISREFYRNGERNYSTSEQDDNAIWSALRAWCEKKGITPFELYPKQPEQPAEGLEEEIDRFENWMETYNQADYPTSYTTRDIARHFAEWQKKMDDLETADLLAIAHLQGMEQQKAKMMEEAAKI